MEEVAPVSVSDRNLLAPEEIKTHAKGDVIGKSERTKTDKKRERRAKKLLQKSKRIQEEARDKDRASKGLKASGKDVQKKMMDKVMKYKNVDKMQINDDSKHIKTSTSFFAQLQDQVTAPVKVVKLSKKIASKAKNDAKKFKL
jgi:U3 small nucleolar RNA-associated protein MPP10